MSWSDAIAKAAEAFTKVFTWKTGGRTQDQNALRTDAEKAHDNFADALSRGELDRLNTARDDQRRVRDEARAKS